MSRAMFLQSAFQFGFLITVETLSFSPEISTGIRVTPWKTQIYWFAGFPADIQIKVCKVSALYYYNNFHANCTAIFLNPEAEIMLNMLSIHFFE